MQKQRKSSPSRKALIGLLCAHITPWAVGDAVGIVLTNKKDEICQSRLTEKFIFLSSDSCTDGKYLQMNVCKLLWLEVCSRTGCWSWKAHLPPPTPLTPSVSVGFDCHGQALQISAFEGLRAVVAQRSSPEPLEWEHWLQDPSLPEN